MLKFEQFQDGLYRLTVETPDGAFKYSGTFQQVDGIDAEKLVPADNGMVLTMKFPGEE